MENAVEGASLVTVKLFVFALPYDGNALKTALLASPVPNLRNGLEELPEDWILLVIAQNQTRFGIKSQGKEDP